MTEFVTKTGLNNKITELETQFKQLHDTIEETMSAMLRALGRSETIITEMSQRILDLEDVVRNSKTLDSGMRAGSLQ